MAEMIKCILNGKVVTNKEWMANAPGIFFGEPPAVPPPANWPLHSDAMGVNPKQIPEAMANAKKHGVPLEFTSEGEAIFTSARHRKAYCEKFGYVDNNAGYADPVPETTNKRNDDGDFI